MIQVTLDRTKPKGWLLGPWNSSVPIPIGYANEGISERHFHKQMFEIYMVARGKSTVIVGNRKVEVKAGDVLVVEPNETHTFLHSSPDYLHFVVNAPFVKDDKVLVK